MSAVRSAETYEKLSFFSIFSRLEWLILEFHEMIIVPHVVACSMVLNFLCDRTQLEGVLKLAQNDHFQVFLAIWVLLLKFLSSLGSKICWNWIKYYFTKYLIYHI